jgi:hypothetical protein
VKVRAYEPTSPRLTPIRAYDDDLCPDCHIWLSELGGAVGRCWLLFVEQDPGDWPCVVFAVPSWARCTS